MADRNYRFMVCVDLPAASLEAAYGKLVRHMNQQACGPEDLNDVEWESGDEAYLDGEQIDPDDLQIAAVDWYRSNGID